MIIFQSLSIRTGTPAFDLLGLTVYEEGIERGQIYACRVASLMTASLLFVRTTSPRALVVALVRIGVPYRFAWMIFVSLLSLATFQQELEMVRQAQMVRGVDPALGPVRRRFTMGRRQMQSMLVNALRRVEVLSVSMELRAFTVAPTRTFIDEYRLTLGGVVLVAVWLAGIIALTVSAILGVRPL